MLAAFKQIGRQQWLVLFLCLLLTLAACNQPGGGTPAPTGGTLETVVAATLAAITPTLVTPTPLSPSPLPPSPSPSATPSPLPTETPSPAPSPTPENNVSGKVCFPGARNPAGIPALTAFFEETGSRQVVDLPLPAGQDRYEILLPPGQYLAYAWLPDFSRGGLYSKAVPCGLKSGCTDHAPLPFSVAAGEKTANIDLCDWYAGPFNVPYPPGKETSQVAGAISGTISYPGGPPPSLNVVAYNAVTKYWYYVNTLSGAATYQLDNLPPGTYQVVAYPESGSPGAHAGEGHALSPVVVQPGEITSGVDINDWNAPEGAFPPDPTR